MANSYSAQGSITIRRLRNGDTLHITLTGNGIPLYQGYNQDAGTVAPDWTVAANQPVLTPTVTSTRGNAVTLKNHSWYYNTSSTPLSFTGAVSGDWQTDSTGLFALNALTGAIKIVGNLASATNVASDQLTYKGEAVVGGIEYAVEKSTDILIQLVGNSAYAGFILATTEQLTSTVLNATLTAELRVDAVKLTSFHTRWYKDNTEETSWAGLTSLTIGRSDVDGTQLFLCEFYRSASDTTPVYRAGVRIIDTLDDFTVSCYISSANQEVDTGKDVTVSARILNQTTGAVYTPTAATWRMDVMKKSDWSVLKTAAASSITVTTAETDSGGTPSDVEVTAEVTWND